MGGILNELGVPDFRTNLGQTHELIQSNTFLPSLMVFLFRSPDYTSLVSVKIIFEKILYIAFRGQPSVHKNLHEYYFYRQTARNSP
jgi:hypothetical protein